MSDNQILYIISAFCFLLISFLFRFEKQFALINFIIFSLYNLILYYNFFYNGEGGSGFLWWFYLIIITSIHALTILIYLTVKFFKK